MAKQIEIPKPTKVPENWCWVQMGKLTSMKSGYPFDSQRFTTEPNETTRPLIRIRDVVRGSTETFTDEDCPEDYVITRGEILIGMDGDFNVAKWQSEDALLNQRVCCIKSSSELYLNDFLFYYLPDPLKKINDATPSVTVKHLSTKTLAITPVPVPPLTEQRRIVDRIEYLFAKLDEAKEKAQSVLDSFETRKVAILHKAFTGELTTKWRELNDIEPKSRIATNVGNIVKLLSGQDFKPEAYNSNGDGIPYITGASNFDNDHVIINRWTSEPTVVAQQADVLLVCKGSGFGKVIIADFETAHIARQIMALRVNPGIDTRYIYYFLQSEYEYLRSNGQGLIPGISRSVVINLPINLPVLREQIEIVRILDSLFAKEQQAKEAAEAVLEKIDLLKKSILARAFRGELGTNDPAEPSAVELIKQILSEKIVVDEPKKPRKIKTPEVDFVAKTIMQALASSEKLTPEKLKAETDLPIDDFYDQLKVLIDNGQVVETRVDGDAYLEAKNADRQPNN